ncbi:MAG: hypothetical protein ACYSUX_07600, partial [Planctomycetota bacterium]
GIVLICFATKLKPALSLQGRASWFLCPPRRFGNHIYSDRQAEKGENFYRDFKISASYTFFLTAYGQSCEVIDIVGEKMWLLTLVRK